MKKLLFILLCLPMIGFGQFNSIDQFTNANGIPDLICPANEDQQPYYYPYQDLGVYTHAKLDLLISDWVDFGYKPVFTPDSVYVTFSGGFANGSINYNNNQQLDNFITNITTFLGPVDYTIDCQYSNNQVDLYEMSYVSPVMGNDGISDIFVYSSGRLASKTRSNFFSLSTIWTKEFIYDSSTNPLIEINYYTPSSSTTPYRTDILTYSSTGNLDNVSISDGRKYEYNYNISSGYCETILLYYNNIFVDTVCEYTFVNSKLQDYSLKSYSCSGGTLSLELEESYSYTYDSFGRIWTEKWYEADGTLGHESELFYFSTPSSIDEAVSNISLKRKLLKTTDILGRETKEKNQLLFYIYDDGTVEKRIVIE